MNALLMHSPIEISHDWDWPTCKNFHSVISPWFCELWPLNTNRMLPKLSHKLRWKLWCYLVIWSMRGHLVPKLQWTGSSCNRANLEAHESTFPMECLRATSFYYKKLYLELYLHDLQSVEEEWEQSMQDWQCEDKPSVFLTPLKFHFLAKSTCYDVLLDAKENRRNTQAQCVTNRPSPPAGEQQFSENHFQHSPFVWAHDLIS